MSSQFFQFIIVHSPYTELLSHGNESSSTRHCTCCRCWNKQYQRWIVLIIGCLGMFAYNYCYDNVVALQNELLTTYHLTNVQYNLLYSIYSFPNIILPFFSGILNDMIGVNTTVLLFFSLIVIGHGIFIIGCWTSYYSSMLVGRFIFGIGCESYAVVVTPLIYEYFKNKELALALALLLSLARVGSSTNDVATYYFFQRTGSITFAVTVGFILLIICLGLLLALIYYRYQSKSVATESTYQIITNESLIEAEKFRLRDLKEFDSVYWLLTLNCGVIYGAVNSWMNIGTGYLQKTYLYSHGYSNILLMVPYIIGSVFTPIFGLLSDHIGKRTKLLFIATIMLVLTHYFFGWQYKTLTPLLPLICLGISFSIFCAIIWPSFAQVVNEKCVGTAYGIPTSFYNLINSFDYIIVGALTKSNNERNTYLNVQWFLLMFSIFSGISVLILLYFDRKTGNRLDKPAIMKST